MATFRQVHHSGVAPMVRPRSEPYSGNPTVRDRREACGNVDYGKGKTGTESGNAETAKSLPKADLLQSNPVFRGANLRNIELMRVRFFPSKNVVPNVDNFTLAKLASIMHDCSVKESPSCLHESRRPVDTVICNL